VLWPLVDNLGTVRDLAKQDGTIAAHYKYDAYGNATSGDTSLTRYLFTSRELDTDTGLQYNRTDMGSGLDLQLNAMAQGCFFAIEAATRWFTG